MRDFSSSVEKYFTTGRSGRVKYLSTRQEKWFFFALTPTKHQTTSLSLRNARSVTVQYQKTVQSMMKHFYNFTIVLLLLSAFEL